MFEDHAVELFSDLPFELMTVAGVLTVMVMMEWRLAVLIVGFLVVAAMASAWVGRPLPILRKSIQAAAGRFSARLQETVSGILTVKVFAAEPYERSRLDECNRDIAALEVRSGYREGFLVPVFDLMKLLGVVLVVWYGARMIVARTITPDELVAFIAYMEILAGPVSRAGKFYRALQQCRAVCQRLAEFLSDGRREDNGERRQPHALAPRPWSIEFDDVTFAYPEAARPALQHVSFRTAPGEIVASVASVADNIAYGAPTAAADVERIARAAGLDEVVGRLQQGLQTIVAIAEAGCPAASASASRSRGSSSRTRPSSSWTSRPSRVAPGRNGHRSPSDRLASRIGPAPGCDELVARLTHRAQHAAHARRRRGPEARRRGPGRGWTVAGGVPHQPHVLLDLQLDQEQTATLSFALQRHFELQ